MLYRLSAGLQNPKTLFNEGKKTQNPSFITSLFFIQSPPLMAELSSWISHIEAFVDTSRPSNQLDASVEAVASLLKNDALTLETLVREMELYLTTTDHVIRARGTLLLGEILFRLTSKPLGSATISSLIVFFTSRLADWQALHGALIGSLGLLSRKSNVRIVTGNDATMFALAYFADVRAQSLAVHDRKLCFEVLQCLLDGYPEAMMTLGNELVHGVLDAIDGEKDPRCLMLTFHLADSLMRIFADQSSLEASFVEELFEILGRYFPIYFTHQKSDDFEIKRDDLSRALMDAFCSSPYFEPFVIPLLLDKLTSSLALAKLDSLKYLGSCISHYGSDRMFKHAKAIWPALKNVIFDLSREGSTFTSTSESDRGMELPEKQIAKEVFTCLHMAISHLNCPNSEPFVSLILDDHDIDRNIESVCLERSYSGISKESQHRLISLGSIMSVASKVSTSCCSMVFQKIFPRLMSILGVSMSNSSDGCIADCKTHSNILNFGALYLCVEFLTSCRDLTIAAQELSPQVRDSWWYLLKDYSGPLTFSVRSALLNPGTAENIGPEHVAYLVKCLEVITTFPVNFSLVSEEMYEDILVSLMSIVTGRSDVTFLWKSALEALVQIGIHIERVHDFKKKTSYGEIVVERVVSLLSLDDIAPPLAFKLQALTEIGIAGPDFMSVVTRGLEEAIFTNFLKVSGETGAAEITVLLLECYSSKVLPWCHKFDESDEVAMRFTIKIWNLMENSIAVGVHFQRQVLRDTTMMAMKIAVGCCTEENQGTIVQKAYKLLSSTTFPLLDLFLLSSSCLESLQSVPDMSGLSCKDEWLISFFASLVMALRPHTPLPDVGKLIRFFTVFLLKGHILAAQALASMINKWPADIGTMQPSAYKLEEAVDVVLGSLMAVLSSSPLNECEIVSNTDGSIWFSSSSSCQINAVIGLAWVGKSLLMRGHERVKEITMLLLKCLLSNRNTVTTSVPLNDSENGHCRDVHSPVARAAADAFHILLSDSEVCLNKRFHATIRPLYKQRFFSIIVPILHSSIKECTSSNTRVLLYRALGHVFSGTPLPVLVAEAKKVIPLLLESLSIWSLDVGNKEMTYNLLLVFSGILMDENGKEAIIENAHIIISNLIKLISYPHMMLVRETAIQCLTAMSALHYTRIYPMRPQVLRALSMSLDDRKRVVRQEAVRCRQAWASIASRSLHF